MKLRNPFKKSDPERYVPFEASKREAALETHRVITPEDTKIRYVGGPLNGHEGHRSAKHVVIPEGEDTDHEYELVYLYRGHEPTDLNGRPLTTKNYA